MADRVRHQLAHEEAHVLQARRIQLRRETVKGASGLTHGLGPRREPQIELGIGGRP
jgi:hypothetical protein